MKELREKVRRFLKPCQASHDDLFLQEPNGRHVEIVNVDKATLIGAAIAGLTN